MVLQCSKRFYSKVSTGFLRSIMQRSFNFQFWQDPNCRRPRIFWSTISVLHWRKTSFSSSDIFLQYLYIYIYYMYIYVCIYIYIYNYYIYKYIYIYIYIYIYNYIEVYIYVCLYIYNKKEVAYECFCLNLILFFVFTCSRLKFWLLLLL